MNKTRLPFIAGFSLTAILLSCELNAEVDDALLEEVYVTGSHIPQVNPRSIIPMTTINASDISLSSTSLLADTLNRLPSAGAPLASQTTTNAGLFAPGLSSIDLRNLSPNRTLVLVNGRRYVGGDNERPNVVDINSIPTAMIDRVEVITGGSSAVYGSEAIAGVVNIITKTDFEGFQFDAQVGQSSQSDGDERKLSFTFGKAFSLGSGSVHITGHAGYSELDEVYSRDRSFSENDQAYDASLFTFIDQDYSSYTNAGTITADGQNFFVEVDNNQWNVFNPVEDGYNRADFRLLQVPLERQDFALNIDYDVTDSLSVFLETSYTETQSLAKLAPTGAGIAFFDFEHYFFSDYPYLPEELQTTLDSFYGEPIGFFAFNRRLAELGPRISKQERDTRRVAFGLDFEDGDYNIGMYFQRGESSRKQHAYGNYDVRAFARGLVLEADPVNTGEFRCADPDLRADGCVPVNIFGPNSIGQDVINYISVDSFDSSRITQEVFAIAVDGAFPSLLPAGDIAIATGIEWRDEMMETSVDEFTQTGFSSSNTIRSEIKGDYDVKEVYLELEIPLLSGQQFIEELSVNTAYRLADYSTVGSHGSWQFGSSYVMNEIFRIRSVISESVRAPNLVELYDPGVQTFTPFSDPCINGGVDGEGATEINCASLGLPSDYDPISSEAAGLSSGNKNLNEETAKTKTIGFVLTPLDGLSISLDYFNIRISDAIEQINPQFKLRECYAASDFRQNSFCDGIERNDAVINSTISRLDYDVQNIGSEETNGWDLDLSYNVDTSYGGFGFRALVTRTNHWEKDVNGIEFSKLGEPGFQKWKANTQFSYERGPVAVTWASRYLGHGSIDNSADFNNWPDDLPSVWYHDLNLRFVVEGRTQYAFYVGANNVTDKEPPLIPSPSANSIEGTNTAAGVYDVMGRFIYIGAEVVF